MTDITIDPTKQTISIEIGSLSLHALGFEITIFSSDGNSVIEKYSGDTKQNNPFTVVLSKTPSSYIGNYISGNFTVISPDGNNDAYKIVFTILEDDIPLSPAIILKGRTILGKKRSIATYHLK